MCDGHREGTSMAISDISIQDQFDWFGPQKLGIFLRREIRISTSRTLRSFSGECSWSSDTGSCFRKAWRDHSQAL